MGRTTSLATLTKTGRAAIARALAARPMHFAWGSGDPAWDEEGASIPSLAEATALVNELGRRTPAAVGFVTPDEEGGVVIPTGTDAAGGVITQRYSVSAEPTPYLYIRVNYDFADAPAATIREVGLFMDTRVRPETPAGQRYFTPAELEDPGFLVAAQILDSNINRSPSTRQTIEFVLPV